MKQFAGFAWMFLVSSAGAGQAGHAMNVSDGVSLIASGISARSVVSRHVDTRVTTLGDVTVGHDDAAGLIWRTGARHKPAPDLVVTIKPSKVTIPDNSKRGTLLATVSVRWSDGAPFSGKVRLTKNEEGICQLADMQLQLGRDTTKADDYTTPVCTVTAFKEGDGH